MCSKDIRVYIYRHFLKILPCAVPCAEVPLVRDLQMDQGAHKGIADQRVHKGAYKA